MGQASRRGNLETRIQQSKVNKAHEEALIENARLDRAMQELQGWKTMVWWQLEMSIDRYERIQRAKHKRDMAMAQVMGTLFGTFMYQPPFRRFL